MSWNHPATSPYTSLAVKVEVVNLPAGQYTALDTITLTVNADEGTLDDVALEIKSAQSGRSELHHSCAGGEMFAPKCTPTPARMVPMPSLHPRLPTFLRILAGAPIPPALQGLR